MATIKPIKRDAFKRGDTQCFTYEFTEPYDGFDWSTVKVNCSFTNVSAPANNAGAAATRLNQSLVVDSDNVATYVFQLTRAESLTLVPGSTYVDECELKENDTYFITPITGESEIVQDYII